MLEEHRVWLSDGVRLEAFRRAVAATVRPGAVVLDLGAGTGILGLLACRAGAARVYAVDEGPVLRIAREAAEANGLGGRFRFLRGRSTRVDLPERVDVVLADHLGCFGVDYGILEAFADARERFLRPGGALVPRSLDLCVALVQSDALYTRVSFWEGGACGFRFPGARDLAANTAGFADLGPADLLSPPAAAARVDLASAPDGPVEGRAALAASRDGVVHGLGGWFEAELAPGVAMTNSPLAAERIRRSPVFLPLARPLPLRRGERVEVRLRHHPAADLVSWTVAPAGAADGSLRQSTFLGQLLEPEDLARLRPGHRPVIGPRGEALRAILEACAAGGTVEEMRRALQERFPRLFPTEAKAASWLARVLGEIAP